MKIINAKVFIDGEFRDVEVQYLDGKITKIAKDIDDDEIIDAKGNYLYAGFVDTHIHGAFKMSFFENGHIDFSNGEEQVREILRKLPEYGVTSCVPTFMSEVNKDGETLTRACRLIRKVRKDCVGADPFKLHYEGPFINSKRSGCINPACSVLPTKEFALKMCDNDLSDVLLICIAPELEGSMEFIDWCESMGVKTEICYTLANSDIVHEAVKHGLHQTSHFYNGYEAMHHRKNGPIVGVLLEDDIKCQILCDNYHVSSDWIKLLIRVKGIDNLYGITDMTCFSGLEDGPHDFPLYGQIIIDGNKVYDINGTIAGSNMTWDKMMKSARDNIGLTMEEVGKLYGENPAKCLDIKDRGKIEVGRKADFTIMDYDYNVLKTIIDGKVYYEK